MIKINGGDNMKSYNYELKKLRIKERRETLNITQQDLSNKVKIKTSNLSNYENLKEIIPIRQLNKICDELKTSFDYILNLSENNNYNQKELDSKVIGERLKEIRKENKLYQETLAKEIGTSKSLICEYEKGVKLVSLPYLYTICKKYNISADYLLGKIDKPKYLK